MTTRIALVSCVKKKRKSDAPARDLYISTLFKGMRRYAEQNSEKWYILSAKYHVLRPDKMVAPYELTLETMSKSERLAWAEEVKRRLLKLLPTGAVVVILVGIPYREYLVPFLKAQGFTVEVPMSGLKFGQQLSWLKAQGGQA